jgi:hypothetical protein
MSSWSRSPLREKPNKIANSTSTFRVNSTSEATTKFSDFSAARARAFSFSARIPDEFHGRFYIEDNTRRVSLRLVDTIRLLKGIRNGIWGWFWWNQISNSGRLGHNIGGTLANCIDKYRKSPRSALVVPSSNNVPLSVPH